MSASGHCATGFGIRWCADLPLLEFVAARAHEGTAPLGDVEVHCVPALAERVPLRAINRGHVYCDGIRLDWNGEVVFDMFEGRRIDYLPGPRWRGSLPASFYSTIAALTAAWLGAVPLHACAIEVGGRALLIAGPSGAGKSSLAAGLIALGAAHVSDDLSVLRVGGGRVEVFPGRPTMRQHGGTAALLFPSACGPIAGDSREKWLVRPTPRTSLASLPLAGALLLDKTPDSAGPVGTVVRLASNLFRPRWMAALPNHPSVRRDLLAIASAAPMRRFPVINRFDTATHLLRAKEALAVFGEMSAKRQDRLGCGKTSR